MTVYLKNSIGLFYVLILIKILYITHTIERFIHILYSVRGENFDERERYL